MSELGDPTKLGAEGMIASVDEQSLFNVGRWRWREAVEYVPLPPAYCCCHWNYFDMVKWIPYYSIIMVFLKWML